jgi:hypothetical protein
MLEAGAGARHVRIGHDDALDLMGKHPHRQARAFLNGVAASVVVLKRLTRTLESCPLFEQIGKAGVYAEVPDNGGVGDRDGGRHRR